MTGGEMIVLDRPWKWSKRKHAAAVLLARGELLDREIIVKIGIGDAQLYRWKKSPEFIARIKEVSARIGDATSRIAIASKVRRVMSADNRHRLLQQVIDERAAYFREAQSAETKINGEGRIVSMASEPVPGATTGLLTKEKKSIGGGLNAEIVDEYKLDTGLLKEMREIEKQVSQELGQWPESKNGVAVNVTVPIQLNIVEEVVDNRRLGTDPLPNPPGPAAIPAQ